MVFGKPRVCSLEMVKVDDKGSAMPFQKSERQGDVSANTSPFSKTNCIGRGYLWILLRTHRIFVYTNNALSVISEGILEWLEYLKKSKNT